MSYNIPIDSSVVSFFEFESSSGCTSSISSIVGPKSSEFGSFGSKSDTYYRKQKKKKICYFNSY